MKNRRSKLTGVRGGLTRVSARLREGTSPYRVLEAVSWDCIRSDRCQQVEGVRICSLCCKESLRGYFRSFSKVDVFGVGIGNERE